LAAPAAGCDDYPRPALRAVKRRTSPATRRIGAAVLTATVFCLKKETIMPEIAIKIAALLALTHTDEVLHLQFRDPQNQIHTLELPTPILGGLIVALTSKVGQIQGTGVAQPMALNGGQPFTLPDGRAGLELLLDDAVRLPVLFPKEAIPILRSALDMLEGLSSKNNRVPH